MFVEERKGSALIDSMDLYQQCFDRTVTSWKSLALKTGCGDNLLNTFFFRNLASLLFCFYIGLNRLSRKLRNCKETDLVNESRKQ